MCAIAASGRMIRGCSQPIRIGASTTADSTIRNGTPTRRRRARRSAVNCQEESGAAMVAARRRWTRQHPAASRATSDVTPASQIHTTIDSSWLELAARTA